jgi:hypothetical protein
MFSGRYGGFPILATAAIALSAGCASGGALTASGSAIVPAQSVARVDAATLAPAPKWIAVSDEENNGVTIYDPSGNTLALLYGFGFPQGLASDLNSDLYVADDGNSRILIFPPASRASQRR